MQTHARAQSAEKMATAVANVGIADENNNDTQRCERKMRSLEADANENKSLLKDPDMLELLAESEGVEAGTYKKTVLDRYKAAAAKVRDLREEGPPIGNEMLELPHESASEYGESGTDDDELGMGQMLKSAAAAFDSNAAASASQKTGALSENEEDFEPSGEAEGGPAPGSEADADDDRDSDATQEGGR